MFSTVDKLIALIESGELKLSKKLHHGKAWYRIQVGEHVISVEEFGWFGCLITTAKTDIPCWEWTKVKDISWRERRRLLLFCQNKVVQQTELLDYVLAIDSLYDSMLKSKHSELVDSLNGRRLDI